MTVPVEQKLPFTLSILYSFTSNFIFAHRELMFADRELVFLHRELVFAAREHKFPRQEKTFFW